MAGLALHRHTARRGDHVHRVPGQSRIVNNPGARVMLQQGLSQQADDVIALDEITFLIEQETAIKIPVPGNAHIGAMLSHRLGRFGPIFRQQWIGNSVRK